MKRNKLRYYLGAGLISAISCIPIPQNEKDHRFATVFAINVYSAENPSRSLSEAIGVPDGNTLAIQPNQSLIIEFDHDISNILGIHTRPREDGSCPTIEVYVMRSENTHFADIGKNCQDGIYSVYIDRAISMIGGNIRRIGLRNLDTKQIEFDAAEHILAR